MLPLFWKVTDDTKHFQITSAQVAVLGRIERVCPLLAIEVAILTAYKVVATTRVNATKELGVRKHDTVNSAFF